MKSAQNLLAPVGITRVYTRVATNTRSILVLINLDELYALTQGYIFIYNNGNVPSRY